MGTVDPMQARPWPGLHSLPDILSPLGFPGGSDGKESACNSGDPGLTPEPGNPLEKEWLPTLVLLPGEFHGQRSLVGYRPCGRKESDMTEQLTHVPSTLIERER